MPYNCPQYKPLRTKKRRPPKQGSHYRTKGWSQIRKRIIQRDHSTCQVCGKICVGRDIQVDHKVARANGGTDADGNLWLLCASCHGRKGKQEGLGF